MAACPYHSSGAAHRSAGWSAATSVLGVNGLASGPAWRRLLSTAGNPRALPRCHAASTAATFVQDVESAPEPPLSPAVLAGCDAVGAALDAGTKATRVGRRRSPWAGPKQPKTTSASALDSIAPADGGPSTAAAGNAGARRRGHSSTTVGSSGDVDGSAAQATAAIGVASAAAVVAAPDVEAPVSARLKPQAEASGGSGTTPAATAAVALLPQTGGNDSCDDSDGGSGGNALSPATSSAARTRVLEIKAALFRNLRKAKEMPTPDSINLILEPVESKKAAAEAAAAAAATPLRGAPLPPLPPAQRMLFSAPSGDGEREGEGGKTVDAGRAAAEARRQRAAEEWVTLRPGERRRRREQQLRWRQQQHQLETAEPYVREGVRQWKDKPGGRRGAGAEGLSMRGRLPDGGMEEASRRVLKPLSAPRVSLPTQGRRAGAAAAAAVAVTAAAATAASGLAGGPEDVGWGRRLADAAARVRRDRVRRANDDFATYLERVAAAAADDSDGAAGGQERRLGGGAMRAKGGRPQRQRQQWRSEGEREARRGTQQEQAQQRQEHASLLRSLAQMFRNFAAQAQPAAAAAAVVAAVSPAAVAALAVARADTDIGTDARRGGALSGFLGLGRARDVQLILQPLTGKKLAEAEAGVEGRDIGEIDDDGYGASDRAAAAGALRARPLPTRSALLAQLRPMPQSRLPSFTRSVGLRIIGRRQPVRLRRLVVAPPPALELVGDGGSMSTAALRALRRRAYFYRQLAPLRQQRKQQQDGPASSIQVEVEEVDEQQRHAAVGSQAEAAAANGAVAPPPASQPRPRPYSLSSRSFMAKRRAQYTDTVKRTVRQASRSGLRPASEGAAVTAAGAAAIAAAATAGSATGAANSGGVVDPEESDDIPRGEYNPAAEVVNDVYEQIMGVRLPERAMYGRRAEALAALSPAAVKEQIRAWVDACGREYTLAFHTREPMLLVTPATTLLLSLEHFSRVFGLPADECVALALRNPAFVGVPYKQLHGAVEAVSEALEVGLQEAGRIVIRCPGLAVRQSAIPVARRVDILGALLPVSRDKLRQVVRQRPQLLSKSAQSLASFMMNVSSALGLPLFDVALMIAGCPNVTSVSMARLTARWEALQAAAGQLSQWADQLAAMSPPSLGRCLVVSEAAMARMQVVGERGLADHPELSSLKKVLTMSATRFEALTCPMPGRERNAAPAAAAALRNAAGAAARTAEAAAPVAAAAVTAASVAPALPGTGVA